MTQILIVESSPREADSASRQLSDKLRRRLEQQYPTANVIVRDLAKAPPLYLDAVTLKAISSKDTTEAMALKDAADVSDRLVDEVMTSDILIISSPMWNFGTPASLKAWIDHVVRAGKTFNYAGAGVEGLATGKRAFLLLASGGVFSEGPWKPWDFVEPYLRHILGFIGISDVQTVRAEGMNIPALAPDAVANGERVIEALAL